MHVPMGVPYFKWKDKLQKKGTTVFSSNYTLYGDMSTRVMNTLHQLLPDLSIYSIDEAFADMRGIKNIESYIHNTKQTVTKWTGIPVSIGVGPTKTLAKMANEIAKKHPAHNGTLIFHTAADAIGYFASFPVGDVWGIGRASANKLARMNIYTLKDLMKKPLSWIRQELHTPGVHIIQELNGHICNTFDHKPTIRKSVIRSRSFGKRIRTQAQMEDAIGYFADRAAEKLREHGLVAGIIKPFFYTSRHSHISQHYVSEKIVLSEPTQNPQVMIPRCRQIVRNHFKQGAAYAKAGVMCFALQKEHQYQQSLFTTTNQNTALMTVYDKLRNKFGKDSLRFGGTGLNRSWIMRQDELSYIKLSDMTQMPRVHAK